MNNFHQKTALTAAHLVYLADSQTSWIDTLKNNIAYLIQFVKQSCVDPPGVEPGKFGVSIQLSEPAGSTQSVLYKLKFTLSNQPVWMTRANYVKR